MFIENRFKTTATRSVVAEYQGSRLERSCVALLRSCLIQVARLSINIRLLRSVRTKTSGALSGPLSGSLLCGGEIFDTSRTGKKSARCNHWPKKMLNRPRKVGILFVAVTAASGTRPECRRMARRVAAGAASYFQTSHIKSSLTLIRTNMFTRPTSGHWPR